MWPLFVFFPFQAFLGQYIFKMLKNFLLIPIRIHVDIWSYLKITNWPIFLILLITRNSKKIVKEMTMKKVTHCLLTTCKCFYQNFGRNWCLLHLLYKVTATMQFMTILGITVMHALCLSSNIKVAKWKYQIYIKKVKKRSQQKRSWMRQSR